MASSTIIRSVTQSLLKILQTDLDPLVASASIKAAPPEKLADESGAVVYVYLYQVLENAQLRNAGPTRTPGQSPAVLRSDPLALDLYFLVIPFASSSNYLDTYTILGKTMQSLHDHAIFSPGQLGISDLTEDEAKQEYRLTLNPLPPGDMFELWQAVSQPYRLSIAYMVRTVTLDSSRTTTTKLVSERLVQASRP
jgi:hypothetical protein